jgi:hypothetical protein
MLIEDVVSTNQLLALLPKTSDRDSHAIVIVTSVEPLELKNYTFHKVVEITNKKITEIKKNELGSDAEESDDEEEEKVKKNKVEKNEDKKDGEEVEELKPESDSEDEIKHEGNTEITIKKKKKTKREKELKEEGKKLFGGDNDKILNVEYNNDEDKDEFEEISHPTKFFIINNLIENLSLDDSNKLILSINSGLLEQVKVLSVLTGNSPLFNKVLSSTIKLTKYDPKKYVKDAEEWIDKFTKKNLKKYKTLVQTFLIELGIFFNFIKE